MNRDSIRSLGEAYNQVVNEQGVAQKFFRSLVPGGGQTPVPAKQQPRGPGGGRPEYATNYKDADRPPGWYTVKVGGKDVARYWPGGKNYSGAGRDKGTGWKVNGPNPNAPIGMGAASDTRAQDIRQGEEDARNQATLRGTMDTAANVGAGSIAIPLTTWSGITTGAQNAFNAANNARQGIGSVRAGGKADGQFVTPGEMYPAQQGGKWGYTTYDRNGQPTWKADPRATPFKDKLDAVKGGGSAALGIPSGTGGSGTPTGTGGGGGQSRTSGMSPEELKAAQDRINQQRRDNIEAGRANNNLPSDYRETELQAGREAETSRPGAGLPVSGGGNQAPGERSGPAATTTPEKSPSSGSLTPMQQWAKNFPKLAAKVKPGQAGYDDIQAMKNSGPKETSVAATKVGNMNKATNNVQTSFNNNSNINKTSSAIKTPNTPNLNMNKAKNNVQKAFKDIPEEAQQILINYMMVNEMCDDEGQAAVIAEHMAPEYMMHILQQEGWEQAISDTVNKAKDLAGSAFNAGKRGFEGKKISGDRNPVDKGLNALTRASANYGPRLGRAVTGGASTPTKQETKQEVKNDSTPNPKAKDKPTSSNSSTPSSTPSSNSGDKGGRLDKALKWASDPKNKDAWMKKESLDGFMEDLLGENRLTPEALEAAAAANLKRDKAKYGHKVHGTDAMKDVIDRVTRKKKGQV